MFLPEKLFTLSRPFVGEFKDGKQQGPGHFTYPDGAVYDGEWKDGKRHGPGRLTHPDGTVYEGEFKDGKKHGEGCITFPSDAVYVGVFNNGQQQGQGFFFYPDGAVYDGSVHLSVICDGCNSQPVLGLRFKCRTCDDFDLCESCYKTTTHEHDFIRISEPV